MRITPDNIDEVVDGVGRGIDDGIRPIVLKLNELGMETKASCEGHIDHGLAEPWVDFPAWGNYLKERLLEFYAETYDPRAVLYVETCGSFERLSVAFGEGASAEDGRREMMRFLSWLEVKYPGLKR